jgi:hypothetical protein
LLAKDKAGTGKLEGKRYVKSMRLEEQIKICSKRIRYLIVTFKTPLKKRDFLYV